MRPIPIALLLLASLSTLGFAQRTPKPGIEVALSPEKRLHLQVTLVSGAATTVTFYRSELPWGNRYSMVFAAVRPNGEPVDLIFPVDDPGPMKISVKPSEVLTGDVDLQYIIRDLNAVKKSDILLFWAYKSPDTLRIPRWFSGMVLIPREK
jgi:hypothetical protein